MNLEIQKAIEATFSPEQIPDVLPQLNRLPLDDVMARSQTNLDNTHLAALLLSNGSLSQLSMHIDAAKIDFRDVIFQATQLSKHTLKKPS